MKKIVVGSDHAGFEGRQVALRTIQTLSSDTSELQAIDLGPESKDSVDYPDFAHEVARRIETGEADFGVLICGTGQGMAMAANRHPGVRAAVVTDEFTAQMARNHNNANVACFGERVVGLDGIATLLKVFLDSHFEGDRHSRRVAKIEVTPTQTL